MFKVIKYNFEKNSIYNEMMLHTLSLNLVSLSVICRKSALNGSRLRLWTPTNSLAKLGNKFAFTCCSNC